VYTNPKPDAPICKEDQIFVLCKKSKFGIFIPNIVGTFFSLFSLEFLIQRKLSCHLCDSSRFDGFIFLFYFCEGKPFDPSQNEILTPSQPSRHASERHVLKGAVAPTFKGGETLLQHQLRLQAMQIEELHKKLDTVLQLFNEKFQSTTNTTKSPTAEDRTTLATAPPNEK
jgi:hypothetical protein